MADFLSHHLFGEEMLPKLPAAAQKAAQQYPVAFRWGLQGPDPLFFYALAWGSPLHRLGNQMHQEKTDALFYAFSRAVNHLNEQRQAIAQAYFYGFLCHYALDSEIHPYVYCRQKQLHAKLPQVSQNTLHFQIESDIDFALYEAKHHRSVTTFDIDCAYTLREEESAVLSVLLHYLLKSVYHTSVSVRTLTQAFEDMRRTEKLLYTENHTMYRGMKQLERIVGAGMITSHFKMQPPNWDCLNLHHEPWCNLWHPQIMRTESVPELFEQAGKQAALLAKQYSAELDVGWMLFHHFDVPFDYGNPKHPKANRPRLPSGNTGGMTS